MTRVTLVFLNSMNKYHVSLGPWSVGVDRKSLDILLSIPTCSFKSASEEFLKSLRYSWGKSGFTIVEESDVVGYKTHDSIAYSHIFRLTPSA